MAEKYTWYGSSLSQKSGQTKPDMRNVEGKDGGCGGLLIAGSLFWVVAVGLSRPCLIRGPKNK
jgi:hypothetical protein